MKILIITPHFWPESFRINDLAEALVLKGNKIDVLTSIPNYPLGSFFSGYGFFKKRYEKYKDISIYRAFVVPRRSGNNFNLFVNYISFVFGSIYSSIFLMKNKYDLIFVFQVSPITVAIPAIIFKYFIKTPIVMWVLDLWPESIRGGGNLKTNLLPNLFLPIVKYIYRNIDKILISSEPFKESIDPKNNYKKNIIYFPQWAEQIDNNLNHHVNLDIIPQNSFKIMFAGNLGEAQNLFNVLRAFVLLKKTDIKLLIVGDGRKKTELENFCKINQLETTVFFLGKFSMSQMPQIYDYSDALLISLKKNEIYKMTIPAKLQSYMSMGKPILSMASGITNKIILDSNSGYICESDDFRSLYNNILKISKLENSKINQFSENAKKYCNKNFNKDNQIDYLLKIFENLVRNIKK